MPNPTPPRHRRHTTQAGTPYRGQDARTRQVIPVVFVAPADTSHPDGTDGNWSDWDEPGTGGSTNEQ